MIYFLVNNNYHFLDVLSHLEELKHEKKTLIQIPHTLNLLQEHQDFSKIYTFQTPFMGMKSFFNIPKIRSVEKQINAIEIKEEDILFVYTEYEILNQYIMYRFKKYQAQVFIIEDGGLPTYLTYSVSNEASLPFKGKIKLWLFRYILGYTFLEFLYYNKIMFPQMNAKYIDGVLLYLNVDIKRNIQKYLIKKPTKALTLDGTKALYLNEKIYNYYCTKKQYEKILFDCLEKIHNTFDMVYFKFHPAETEENKQWQLRIIQQFPNVYIITENDPIETLIETYNAQYVFSFLSAALLNLNAFGVTPVYMYHFYPELKENTVFQQIDSILKNSGYIFWGNSTMINTVGFPQETQSAISLQDFIENKKQRKQRK